MLALGAGVGATLLAGCTGGTDPTTESETDTGEFRLLISDRPADIADFERLDVSFSDARIFRADTDETTTPMTTQEATTTQNATTTATQTETNTTATDETTTTVESPEDAEEEAQEAETADVEDEEEQEENEEEREKEEEDGEKAGFFMLDLEGKTVDLTQVIGEDATPVFEGELDAGTYTKIELNVADSTGIVDGEEVDVKVPSEKLMITNNFAVTPEEPVEFVFDINVVKRGPKNGYILKPVISESGVAGRDVEYQEVPQNGTTSGA